MPLEDYKNVISTCATIVTIIQFLSGSDICRNIIKQGSTGDISGLPFVVGSFSAGLWLTYSFLLNDTPMMVTNLVGMSLQVIYLVIYIKYCISLGPWKMIRKQMLFFGILFSAIVYYASFAGVSVLKNIGLLCCVASIIFCISPLVSLREVFRTKSTAILPFPLILSMFFVGGLWCLYGSILKNSFIMYPNFLVFILAGFQLSLFLVFPSKVKEGTLEKELIRRRNNFTVDIPDSPNDRRIISDLKDMRGRKLDYSYQDRREEDAPNVHHFMNQLNDATKKS
ncbi:Sugar transporter SWEET1 [Armadillidium nasatum]|uniref:Sugar transporter SWEET n=1 Tax=Armadillidium nasatum TaxID=96803 RepID=A0A5N5SWE2_9CRUS|nr:Sugar transporter SWEET1 [Armadillidium nasatum]